MNNEYEMNVIIPDITATFVGTKRKDGFSEVVNDFSNAKEVRILTYSNIGYRYKYKKLEYLRNLSENTKLRIIVAMPGLKNPKKNGKYDDSQYTEESIKEELDRIKNQLNTCEYASKDIEMNVCFKNHAKLIGTENILYIGSANYNDFSCRNYEAGMIIRDKSAIKEIYEEYFDKIVAVRYWGDTYDEIRLKLLSFVDDMEELDIALESFVEYFEERYENFKNIKNIYKELFENMKNIILQLEKYDRKIIDDLLLEDMDIIQNNLEDIHIQILNEFDSGYKNNIEFFADYYEDQHMEKKGVTSSDSWIDEDTPYTPLSEDAEQEDYISEYWADEMKSMSSVKETEELIRDTIKIVKELVVKDSYELFKENLIQIGTDENALK